MSEFRGRSFLRALYHSAQQLKADGDGRAVDDALFALARAADVLTGAGEVVMTVGPEAFFLGSEMLPQASTEFRGLLRDLAARDIESITLLPGTTPSDLGDLAALVAGTARDLPAEGTVRLNEQMLSGADLAGQPLTGLRRSYVESLDALRSVNATRGVEMAEAGAVVDGLLTGTELGQDRSIMLATIHNYDELTYFHSVNVCLLALALGRAVGLDRARLKALGAAALLHDVGRVIIDDPGLRTEGPLTNEEWAIVRRHPQEGAQAILLAGGDGHELAAIVALEHHRHVAGGGYPELQGRPPHPFARMVAIADAYDAITSHRPHRAARTPHEALRLILDDAGTVYDRGLVEVFVHMLGVYPPGSVLRMAGGDVVMVTGGGDDQAAVRVRDAAGRRLEVPEPVVLDPGAVVAQLSPEDAGIDPASLVESVREERVR